MVCLTDTGATHTLIKYECLGKYGRESNIRLMDLQIRGVGGKLLKLVGVIDIEIDQNYYCQDQTLANEVHVVRNYPFSGVVLIEMALLVKYRMLGISQNSVMLFKCGEENEESSQGLPFTSISGQGIVPCRTENESE